MNWQELTSRERDALVAEKVMGITFFWEDAPVDHYTTDIAAAWQVESEIERQGLGDDYIDILITVVDAPDLRLDIWPQDADLWKLIRATPEQRCLAALRAKGVEV